MSVAPPASGPPAAARPRVAVLLGDEVLGAVVTRRLGLLGYEATAVPHVSELPIAAAAVGLAGEAGDGGGAGGGSGGADDPAGGLVMIDLGLPDRAALKAVERLAAGEATRRVPVLGLATDCPLAFVEEAHGFGVTDFLVVPFDPLVLEAKIAALVALSKTGGDPADDD